MKNDMGHSRVAAKGEMERNNITLAGEWQIINRGEHRSLSEATTKQKKGHFRSRDAIENRPAKAAEASSDMTVEFKCDVCRSDPGFTPDDTISIATEWFSRLYDDGR